MYAIRSYYVPSKDELNMMYSNLIANGLRVFINGTLWSSSETSATTVWIQNFANGSQSSGNKSSYAYAVPVP